MDYFLRAEARKNEAEKAFNLLSTKEVDVLTMAEEAAGKCSSSNLVGKVYVNSELKDEICTYIEANGDPAGQVVEDIEVKPGCDDDWKNSYVKDVV